MAAKGIVFDIQKFSIHDGPGIRTNVFLKGCPLHCVWCHNPESWSRHPQILFSVDKCTGCRRCAAACPNGCHTFTETEHIFNREACVACGACAKACFNDALELCGETKTTDEALAEVLKDKPFYETSHGGMTISGGEPMAQFEFTRELLEKAKDAGLHTAIETSGFADQELYRQLLPLVDLFLWDVKSVNPEKHRKFTGQGNERILENLRFIDANGANYYLRCPLVPGLNDSDEDLIAIAELANSLSHPLEIDVEPYHPLGVSKAKRMGKTDGYEAEFAPKETIEHWLAVLKEHTQVPVKKQ